MCQTLSEYYRRAWSKVKSASWGKLVRDCNAEGGEKLRELLAETDRAVREMAADCREVRRALAGLLRRTGTVKE